MNRLPHLSRRTLLWIFLFLAFLGVVVAAVIVPGPTTWFLILLVAFTFVVILLAPWLLGN